MVDKRAKAQVVSQWPVLLLALLSVAAAAWRHHTNVMALEGASHLMSVPAQTGDIRTLTTLLLFATLIYFLHSHRPSRAARAVSVIKKPTNGGLIRPDGNRPGRWRWFKATALLVLVSGGIALSTSPSVFKSRSDRHASVYRDALHRADLTGATRLWEQMVKDGDPAPDLLHEERADHHALLLQFDAAVDGYRRALLVSRTPRLLSKLARVLPKRGYAADRAGDIQEAIGLAAEAVRDCRGHDNPTELAHALHSLGAALLADGQVNAAESALTEASIKCRSAAWIDAEELADIYNCIASVCDSRSNATRAEHFYNLAISTIQLKFPGDSAMRAIIMGNRALCLKNRGELLAATKLYREALGMLLRACDCRDVGTDCQDLRVATVRLNLALVLSLRHELSEAEALARLATRTRTTLLGANHPDLGNAQGVLAEILRESGDYSAETEELTRSSLQIYEQAFRDDHPKKALALSNLAVFLLNRAKAQGQVLSAQDRGEIGALLDRAVDMLRRLSDGFTLGWVLRNKGSWLSQEGERLGDTRMAQDGIEALIEARDLVKSSAGGRETAEVASCTFALGMAYKRSAQYDMGADCASAVATMWRKLLGVESKDEAKALALYARCVSETGAIDTAHGAAHQAMAMVERTAPEGDPARVACQKVLDQLNSKQRAIQEPPQLP